MESIGEQERVPGAQSEVAERLGPKSKQRHEPAAEPWTVQAYRRCGEACLLHTRPAI
jgi:hypothetical protein